MRITMAAVGTRGDVQPMIALGLGLLASGHDVTMIAGSNFAGWVSQHGLRFVPTVDMEAVMSSEKGVAWSESGGNPLKQLRMMRGLMNEFGQGMIDPIQAATTSSDLLITSFSARTLVQTAGEKSGVPYVDALLQPQFPTRSGAASLTPLFAGSESIVNRWMGAVADRMIWSVVAETTNRYRSQLGLPAHSAGSFGRARAGSWAVMGFSRHVVPEASDWPEDAVVTGFWFLDEGGASPPRGLIDFLGGGPPPIYVGFGSMSQREPRKTLECIVAAARPSGQRLVIASGRADLACAELPPEVYLVESVPHDWLFPRVAGVVHHGGAGTTAAALRAGKPSLVVPHMSDQPYWGRRIYELGAGPKPVPRHKLRVETLASGFEQLASDRRIRDGAAALGEKIRAERGVEAAVAAIDSLMN